MQAGLAALVAFDASRSAAENAAADGRGGRRVRAGAITRASRYATVDGLDVTEGQFLGLVDGQAVAAATSWTPSRTTCSRASWPTAPDVLTVLVGDEARTSTALPRSVSRPRHPELEMEITTGGQPHYPLLFGAE